MKDITIKEWVEIFSAIAIILTFILAYREYKLKVLIDKSILINQLNEIYMNDEELIIIYNKIEWNEVTEENRELFFNDHKYRLEKFFAMFEYYLWLKNRKILNEKDYTIYTYMVETITKNKIIKDYFYTILSKHVTDENLAFPYPNLKKLIDQKT